MEIKRAKNRINGVDEFMVQEVAGELLREMESAAWTKGEVNRFPGVLSHAIEANSKREEQSAAFTVHEITQRVP